MKINGLGCSLVDNLYSPVDFKSEAYKKWSGKNNKGAAIITGGLVFGEELEKFSERKYSDILNEIVGELIVPEKNIGGPSIVALINIAQMLDRDFSIGFYGIRSDDENGQFIKKKLDPFNIDLSGYSVVEGQTPFTDVLSDPHYNNGDGERSFINYMGAAAELSGDDLGNTFFDADILIFGGTALTPGIHKDLSALLKKGKEKNCLNFINTVYDFLNQKLNPGKPWPLVASDSDFQLIDLLITDKEEALRISGEEEKEAALAFFADRGVHSVVITHGSEDILCCSDGLFFEEKGIFTMPVSELAGIKIKELPPDTPADTTGCGDNFAGGVYASAAHQLHKRQKEKPSLIEAASWGIVSGGFAGLCSGGVYYEKKQGEKTEKLKIFLEAYKEQTGYIFE